jgi:hypothetical protein
MLCRLVPHPSFHTVWVVSRPSLVEFEFDGKIVRIVRANTRKGSGGGARLVAHLRGRGDVAMSTDEIMALTRDD